MHREEKAEHECRVCVLVLRYRKQKIKSMIRLSSAAIYFVYIYDVLHAPGSKLPFPSFPLGEWQGKSSCQANC